MSQIVRKIICTSKACKPLGPYSQAVQVGNTVYLSGVLGWDTDAGKLVSGGTAAEARLALKHMGHILEAAGTCFANVIKVSVLLENIDDSAVVNDIYKEFFVEPYPARAAYQVGKLPKGAKIEIEAIAVTGNVVTEA